MDNTSDPLRLLNLSTRLYQALLAVYPAGFRRVYGGPMLQVFRDSSRQALLAGGNNGLLILWIRTLLDTVQTALEEHSQRGVDMSKEKFVKLAGWALVLGGPLVALGGVAAARPEYDPFNANSLSLDKYFNTAGVPMIVLGLLLLTVGFVGFFIRYGQAAGKFGRFILGLVVLSGVVGILGGIGLGFNDAEPWLVFLLGLTSVFLGATLFGLVCLQRQVLPRWNWLPLVGIIWLPLLYGLVPGWLSIPLWLLSLAGLAGLGYLLQSDSQPAGTAAAAV